MTEKKPVIARIYRSRRLCRVVAKQYMRDNKDQIQRVQDRGYISVQMEDKEVVFMTLEQHARWCAGKEYLVGGKLYRSGRTVTRREGNGQAGTAAGTGEESAEERNGADV